MTDDASNSNTYALIFTGGYSTNSITGNKGFTAQSVGNENGTLSMGNKDFYFEVDDDGIMPQGIDQETDPPKKLFQGTFYGTRRGPSDNSYSVYVVTRAIALSLSEVPEGRADSIQVGFSYGNTTDRKDAKNDGPEGGEEGNP